jgi:hypothetical protein
MTIIRPIHITLVQMVLVKCCVRGRADRPDHEHSTTVTTICILLVFLLNHLRCTDPWIQRYTSLYPVTWYGETIKIKCALFMILKLIIMLLYKFILTFLSWVTNGNTPFSLCFPRGTAHVTRSHVSLVCPSVNSSYESLSAPSPLHWIQL